MSSSPLAATALAASVSWMQRDVSGYARSMNMSGDGEVSQKRYLNEKDVLLPALSTFPLALIYKTNKHSNSPKSKKQHEKIRQALLPSLPNLPALDCSSDEILDVERSIEILKILPLSSDDRDFEIRSSVIGVWDRGVRGTVIKTEYLIVEIGGVGGQEGEEVYARITETTLFVGKGGWGGPKGPSGDIPKPIPNSQPDVTFTHKISDKLDACAPGGADSEHSVSSSTSTLELGIHNTPVMSSISSWTTVCQAIVTKFCNGDPTALRTFQARLASAVKVGDTLVTDIWVCGKVWNGSKEEGEDWREVRFCSSNVQDSGKACLTNGSAIVRFKSGKFPSKL